MESTQETKLSPSSSQANNESENKFTVTKRNLRDHINVRSKSNLHESKYKRHSGGAIFLIEQTIKNSLHQSQNQTKNLFKSNSLSSLVNDRFVNTSSKAKTVSQININEPECNNTMLRSNNDKSNNETAIIDNPTNSNNKENSEEYKEKPSPSSSTNNSGIVLANIEDSYNDINDKRRLSSQSSSSCNTTVVSEVTLGTINFCDISKRFNKEVDLTCLRVPIIGYEVMEERARFTVYKLRLMTNIPGESWLLLRRYTDFVRLHCRLKTDYPDILLHLPKKKWFGDNFHPKFLQDRVQGLQEFVNSVLSHHILLESAPVKDFFCLNDPPVFSECLEDSRALFEAQEETIMNLRAELAKRDAMIADLKNRLSREYSKNAQKHVILKNTKETCEKCNKEINNTLKQFEDEVQQCTMYTSTPIKN